MRTVRISYYFTVYVNSIVIHVVGLLPSPICSADEALGPFNVPSIPPKACSVVIIIYCCNYD